MGPQWGPMCVPFLLNRAKPAAPGAGRRQLPPSRAPRARTRLLPAVVVMAVLFAFVLQNRQRGRVILLVWSGRLCLREG